MAIYKTAVAFVIAALLTIHNHPSAAAPKAAAASDQGLIQLSPEQIRRQDIEVAPALPGTLSRHILVPGTITMDADLVTRVPALVVGTVAELRKRLGDAVEKNDVVAVLDSREVADAKSEYLTAAVNFELQNTNFERAQSLWTKQVSSEAQFLQAKATFTEAQLRFDLARQKLSALGLDAAEVAAANKSEENTGRSSLRRFEIRSPIKGRVVDRRVDVGMAVGKEGDPADLYTVADLTTLWVDLTVPPSDLSKIKEGSNVKVIANGDDKKRAEARIRFVSPILNQDTRSARVIASLDNRDLDWRPGSFVTAEIDFANDPVKVLVPRSAVQSIGGERVVFVRIENGFMRRDVKVGRSDDDAIEIVSGLEAGDAIAVKNTFLLKAELGKSEAKHDD